MKILFSYELVGRGGDALQVLALAEALQTLGHEVTLLGPVPLEPYKFSGRIGRLRSFLRRLPWWARDLIELGLQLRLLSKSRRLLRENRFDLVLHRAGIYDFAGAYLARKVRRPLIAHLDAPFPIERGFRGEGYFHFLHRACMRKLGERAKLIFTMSQASRDYYVELGLPQEKIIILPNGVSSQLLEEEKELAGQHPPLVATKETVIGFVGSLSRWHRVDLLLEALQLLDAEHPRQFRLVVVGYGEEYSRLRATEKSLGLEGLVSWLGPLPHEEAFEQITRFDIAVLPHTLPTGAPMKLFEYAAVARPTIAPDLPNLRELFSEEEMYFVEPESPQALAEAILKLSQKPEAAYQVGKRARQRVQEYTWENIVLQLLKAVQNLTQHED